MPFPSPGDLPDSGMELRSAALQADALPSESPGKPQGGIEGRYVHYLESKKERREREMCEMHFFEEVMA